MTDLELLQHAIDAAAPLSDRRFAVEILGVEERTLRYWRTGRRLSGIARIVCRAIALRPALVEELRAAHERLVQEK